MAQHEATAAGQEHGYRKPGGSLRSRFVTTRVLREPQRAGAVGEAG